MICKLSASGLSASYGRGERQAISDIDLDVEPGEVLAVIGPNGAGKSTLLRVLAGALEVSAGEVSFCGRRASKGDRLNVGDLVGYLPAQPDPDRWITVGEALMAARLGPSRSWPRPSAVDIDAAMDAARRAGIGGMWGRRLGELSTGERKMALLAAAISRSPSMLLLDEPTAGLDLRNQALAISLIAEEARRGAVVVASSHELHLVGLYAHRVMLLRQGRRLALGGVRQVLRADALEEAYGVELDEVSSLVPRLQGSHIK